MIYTGINGSKEKEQEKRKHNVGNRQPKNETRTNPFAENCDKVLLNTASDQVQGIIRHKLAFLGSYWLAADSRVGQPHCGWHRRTRTHLSLPVAFAGSCGAASTGCSLISSVLGHVQCFGLVNTVAVF